LLDQELEMGIEPKNLSSVWFEFGWCYSSDSVGSVFLVRNFSFKCAQFGAENPGKLSCKIAILSTHNFISCKFAAVCQNSVRNLHRLSKNCHFLNHLFF